MQEIKTTYNLLYLTCERMMFGVKQLQRKNWVRQSKKLCCIRARQTHEGIVQEISIASTRIRDLRLGDLCVGVRQLHLEDMN